MYFIELFENHTEYENFASGGTMELPNVSHCIQENEVHYNPIVEETRLMVTYTVIDDSEPTQLYYFEPAIEGVQDMPSFTAREMFDKVEIDGAEVSISDLDVERGFYELSEGTHTVAYTLKDPTVMGDATDYSSDGPGSPTLIIGATFNGCEAITDVRMPDSVAIIGVGTFAACSGLTAIKFSNAITDIRSDAFYNCSSLTNVVLPDGLTTIKMGAFGYCENLTTVNIPSSVTTIESQAFCACPSIDENSKSAIQAINPNGWRYTCGVD